jgi:uncharacterized protein (TIGR03067 family)
LGPETFLGISTEVFMKWHSAILLLAIPLLALAGGEGAKDSKKIQGTWVLAEAEINGQTGRAEDRANLVWSFDGDKYAIKYKSDIQEEGTFKLDPDKTPRAFDKVAMSGTDKGKSYPGIYKFVNEELVVCFSRDARPKEFTGKAGSGQIFMVFKRKKS